jgi:hypothetical protein
VAPELRTVHCKHCNRLISWVRTEKGKSMPIDPTPNEQGNVYLRYAENGQLVAHVRLRSEKALEGIPYFAHFATCPVLNIGNKVAMTGLTVEAAAPKKAKPEPPPQLDLFNQPTQELPA